MDTADESGLRSGLFCILYFLATATRIARCSGSSVVVNNVHPEPVNRLDTADESDPISSSL